MSNHPSKRRSEIWADTRPPPICVHILQCARPLCGFTEELPGNWPDRHYWLALDEEDDYVGQPMCEACLLAKHGYRERCKWGVLRVFQHVQSGLYFIRLPGLVLGWTASAWWRLRLIRLSHWEFVP